MADDDTTFAYEAVAFNSHFRRGFFADRFPDVSGMAMDLTVMCWFE